MLKNISRDIHEEDHQQYGWNRKTREREMCLSFCFCFSFGFSYFLLVFQEAILKL